MLSPLKRLLCVIDFFFNKKQQTLLLGIEIKTTFAQTESIVALCGFCLCFKPLIQILAAQNVFVWLHRLRIITRDVLCILFY